MQANGTLSSRCRSPHGQKMAQMAGKRVYLKRVYDKQFGLPLNVQAVLSDYQRLPPLRWHRPSVVSNLQQRKAQHNRNREKGAIIY